MNITISYNPEKNGIEVTFAAKPDESVREWLKAYRFRWNRSQGLWYNRHKPGLWRTVHDHFALPVPPDPSQVANPQPDGWVMAGGAE